MIPMQKATYGPTKFVVHWLTKAIRIEEPELIALLIDPGYVRKRPVNSTTRAVTYLPLQLDSDRS